MQTIVTIPLPSALDRRTPYTRPSALFVAQLIAAAQQLPQARLHRRAEPKDATAIYGAATAMLAPTAASAGQSLSRLA